MITARIRSGRKVTFSVLYLSIYRGWDGGEWRGVSGPTAWWDLLFFIRLQTDSINDRVRASSHKVVKWYNTLCYVHTDVILRTVARVQVNKYHRFSRFRFIMRHFYPITWYCFAKLSYLSFAFNFIKSLNTSRLKPKHNMPSYKHRIQLWWIKCIYWCSFYGVQFESERHIMNSFLQCCNQKICLQFFCGNRLIQYNLWTTVFGACLFDVK